MKLINFYRNIIKEAILNCGYELDKVELMYTSRPDLGQFQCNDSMKLARKYKKSPYLIAKEIVENLKYYKEFTNLNVAKPGFINISFSDEVIIKYLKYNFVQKTDKSKKIFIDYGGANIAKTLHVGHIRSANIGEALKRLCVYLGNDVISDVHLGDWGLQIGMVIYEIKQRYPDLPCFSKSFNNSDIEFKLTSKDLEYLYPIASRKANENKEIMDEVRLITNNLQLGHKGYVKLWKRISEVSKIEIKNIYDRLNVKFDLWEGESDAAKYIDEMMEYLKLKKLIYENNGAIVMNVDRPSDNEPIPPLILKKSDGSDLYSTTELASLYYRVRKFCPDEIWYVVDKRQSLHFKQVFRAAYISEIVPKNIKLHFIGFGTMNGENGKPFKTREGKAMTLSTLIDVIKDEVSKNLSTNVEKERSKVSEIISISVLKCADLCANVETDYTFDPIKFSQLNGKTGIYLLYSALRIKSLLKKADKHDLESLNLSSITCNLMRDIILKLLNFENILNNSFEEKSLHKILEYLFELNGMYNNFYSKNKILSEKDTKKRKSWLSLSKEIYDVNLKLLNILAIDLPYRL
ncbi:MAG: arginine--tRNA ligase [Firmicutes bacterium]|nr:arginine--tRNA ligase [Bacillota bacterium]